MEGKQGIDLRTVEHTFISDIGDSRFLARRIGLTGALDIVSTRLESVSVETEDKRKGRGLFPAQRRRIRTALFVGFSLAPAATEGPSCTRVTFALNTKLKLATASSQLFLSAWDENTATLRAVRESEGSVEDTVLWVRRPLRSCKVVFWVEIRKFI